jgi:hypothetical protein
LKPEASSNVIGNQPFTIVWDPSGFVSQDEVTLSLYRLPVNGTSSGLEYLFNIASFLSNTGQYEWRVPKFLGTSDYIYQIELVSVVSGQTYRSRTERFIISAP